jgi:hypothetical protein
MGGPIRMLLDRASPLATSQPPPPGKPFSADPVRHPEWPDPRRAKAGRGGRRPPHPQLQSTFRRRSGSELQSGVRPGSGGRQTIQRRDRNPCARRLQRCSLLAQGVHAEVLLGSAYRDRNRLRWRSRLSGFVRELDDGWDRGDHSALSVRPSSRTQASDRRSSVPSALRRPECRQLQLTTEVFLWVLPSFLQTALLKTLRPPRSRSDAHRFP